MGLREICVTALLTFTATAVLADDHMPPPFFPIETYSCSYNEGKGLNDFLETAAKWNKWADKNYPAEGFAAVLTPYLANVNEMASDVFWMNISPTFEAMGSWQDHWVANGSELVEEFDEICTNNSHSMFLGQAVKAPTPNGTTTGYIAFESCSLKEGASMQQLLAADEKFRQRQASLGNDSPSIQWWPMAGMSRQMEGDFYLMSAVDSMQSLGQNIDKFISNMTGEPGAYDGLVDCSGRNVFSWQGIRSPNQG